MANVPPDVIPRWHQALLFQIAIAVFTAPVWLLFGNIGQTKAWLLGAVIAALPHAAFVYYAGRYQQHSGVRKTLRSTQRGMALKMALTALLFMWAYKVNGSNHAVVLLLGFAAITLVGAVHPLLLNKRQ